jgi:hypothetical protein
VSGSQRGAIVGGVWLVGLGLVFLAQQALDLPWIRAWPLFLVLVGIGSGVSAIVGLAGRRRSAWVVVWALLGPLIVTTVGVLLVLDVAELVEVDAIALLATWWPVALILIGALILVGSIAPGARAVEERVRVELAGADSGDVVLKFGAGRLEVGPGTAGVLVDGEFEGGAIRRDLGPGRVELEADLAAVWPAIGEGLHWSVRLAPDIPIALRLEGGASRSILDLTDLLVTSLTVKTGASETRIRLSRRVDRAQVRVESGAAQVSIEVPSGVAARIRSQMGLGSSRIDGGRFPRVGDRWVSPDFDTAERRVEIDASGGVGSITVS